MASNINREDLDAAIVLLKEEDPILTQSSQVRGFEQEWSDWLGVGHSVFVNSGSSANLLSMSALRILKGEGEVITPPLTWVSDVASVLQNGHTPVFADINPRTLAMNTDAILSKISPRTKAVFITHVLGYNGLTQRLLDELRAREIPLVEDVCESHGATFDGQKLGSFGWMSNFSFYYAHHLSTIEGGMICTDDEELYDILRMLRSHGMVRESGSKEVRDGFAERHPDLNPDFIFSHAAYNVRSTEVNAVIGRSQLKRLDANNEIRRRNLRLFLEGLDQKKFFTEFNLDGSCNYAFTLLLRDADDALRSRVEGALRGAGVEFRRGMSGGGNQMRQPYLRPLLSPDECENFPNVNHVHFYGYYIGNYPSLDPGKIGRLCEILNAL
ncbi:MAG: DegT/DnrJ/EryC1/StrS family aminotransferase [Verrucomicrobiales bacterium]|nr:DegT/DnrJ/EryC1/StrS family aminotransferase [Verrucomicrobiales bacterium]